MKNKIGCIICLLFLILYDSIFAQENDEENVQDIITQKSDNLNKLPQNFLIQGNNHFNIFFFQFIDGTPVWRREATMLISNVPANQDLMKQIKRGTIASWVTFGLMIITGGTAITYISCDFHRSEIVFPILIGSFVGSGITFTLANGQTNKKYLRAVDNYNLYILGLQ
ncbi:MAG: hypothetical protein FWG46_04245 [Treponema sp.]|nr:hypothetical protein [Treponema sp.]